MKGFPTAIHSAGKPFFSGTMAVLMDFPIPVARESLLTAIAPAVIPLAFFWGKVGFLMDYPIAVAGESLLTIINPAGILWGTMSFFMLFQEIIMIEFFPAACHSAGNPFF